MLETSYCTDRANVVKVAAIRATSGRQFLLRPNRSCALYAAPRRKRALDTRGLLPSGYTARDLVRDVLVPSRRLLSSRRVSTMHSRQTSDTNRLFGRNKSPRQMSDLFDCTYASSYPLSQSAFELEIIRGRIRSPGVPGTYAFN